MMQTRNITVRIFILFVLLFGQMLPGTQSAAQPVAEEAEAAMPVPASEPSIDVAGNADPAMAADEHSGVAQSSAYVRDFDLGNGRHTALVSSTPLNYQAEDGSWQPIDARFRAVPGGFFNPANALKVSAADQRAALEMESAGQTLGWVPQALVWIGPDGREVTLAGQRDPAQATRAVLTEDGHSLRYENSWSLAGLSEEIALGPGSVEESLIFNSRPLLPQEAVTGLAAAQPGFYQRNEATLALRAVLRLPGQAVLFADGASRSQAFSTAHEVQVRDPQGQVLLTLAIPFAFEQALPAARVQATYRLTPIDGSTWQVEVRTPWKWWQATERQYPAVLDPYMTIHHGNTAASTYSEAGGCSYSEVDPFKPGDLYRGSAVSIGRNPQCSGVFRALVRFDTTSFPTLPAGAAVDKVELFAAAAAGYYRTFSAPGYTPVRLGAAASVEVRQVLDEWAWASYGGVEWGSYQTSASLGAAESFYISPPEDRSGGGWPVHFSIPPSVYTTWQDAGQNFGLELRLADEAWYCSDCGNFVEVPNPPNWSGEDTDTNPANLWPDGGGFILVIDYQAPELQAGQIYGYSDDLVPNLLLPSDHADLSFTDHHYGLPNITAAWSAVAVKGVQAQQNFIYAAGHPRLQIDQQRSNASKSASTYIMMRGDPGDKEVQVLTFGKNQSGERVATNYLMEVKTSTPINNGNPIQPGQTIHYPVEMVSTEILRVFDLNLVAGTNVQVKIQQDGSSLKAKLFPPTQPFQMFAKSSLDAVAVTKPLTPVENGGVWGLAVEFPKNVSQGESGGLFMISFAVDVTVCNADEEITDQGCWKDPVPTPAMTCAQVGPYWIRSETAFSQNAVTLEHYNTSPGVMLGWGTCSSAIGTRWVLATNEVRFKDEAPYLLEWLDENNISLVYKPTGGTKVKQDFLSGAILGNPNLSDSDYGYLTPHPAIPADELNFPLDESDAEQATLKINVQLQQAEGQADIIRPVETRPESHPGVMETFTFSLEWTLQADVALEAAHSRNVDFVSGPSFTEAGAMELHPENNQWKMDFHPGAGGGKFSLLRAPARIAHSTEMGGAWKPVQMVLLPYGEALPGQGSGGNTYPCLGYCMDIRHPTSDTFTSANRNWEMPDIEINGQANMLAFSKPGTMDIFSSDQPNSINDVTVPFSFKTVGGYVSSYRGTCPEDTSGQIVQVIHGKTQMSLPGLGSDSGEFPGIEAEFFLCQNALRQVSLSYDSVPIPVGNTGLFISRVGGTVTLTPENTQVVIDVDYRSGASAELTSGTARVTINTAGLFSAQVINGNLVGIMNYDGYATVTWNPLSFSTGLHGWMDLWILHNEAILNASIWQGQGWQNQYGWLPDDGATHFAGSFVTRMTIPEGAILSEPWFPDIPWDDWELFSIELSIGEFHCGGCSDGYEYGIQGTFSHTIFTLGYDVGLYVGFESGMDVIIGGGQHTLVNQYPATLQTASGEPEEVATTLFAGGNPLAVEAMVAPDSAAAEVTWPLTVTGHTSSMLVGLGWENLASQPRLSLLRPDGVEITPANALSYGVNVSANHHGIFYGITDPMGDNWTAKISNATTQDYWHLIFLTNNQVPAFNLLTPNTSGISWDPNWDGTYLIEWDVPVQYENDEYLVASLYYTKTVSGVMTPTVGLITDKATFMKGHYNWDMIYLGEGTYQVWGVLRNTGAGDYFDPPQALGENQWLGVSKSMAPGSIVLNDTVAPAVPTGLSLTPLDEAFLACWDANPAKDLAGYLLTYTWENVNDVVSARNLRAAASVPYSDAAGAPQQCARIGSLNAGKGTAVMVAAYDNSGNLSANSDFVTGVVAHAPNGGPFVSGLEGDAQSDHSVILTWNHGTAAGYWLYYAVDTPAGPHQPFSGATEGASPIRLGAVGTYTVHGLPAGHMVHFAIQAIDSAGRLGPISEDEALWLVNGNDANNNKIPDDWEQAYGLSDAGGDPDQDCLVNIVRSRTGYIVGGEIWAGTNPTLPDTDGDGYMDGSEIDAQSDPLDPFSQPEDLQPSARLSLSANALMFRAGTAGASPPAQFIEVINTGVGTITPTISVDAAWLNVEMIGNQLKIMALPTGLAHGKYVGTITIGGVEGVCTVNAPQQITVILGVFDGVLYNYPIYLPLIVRN